jgi:nitrite reductase/ring-hydroxylating ferredoxin subunit
MNRRQFTKNSIILTGGVTIVVASVCSCSMMSGVSKMPTLDENLVNHVKQNLHVQLVNMESSMENGALKFEKDGHKILVIKANNGRFLCYENRCTHGGRELNYIDNGIQCSSFGHSKFTLEGTRIAGPAENDLTVYPSAVVNNELVIQLS